LLKLSVSDGKPVIYGSFNHCLGIFGFANLPILKDQKSLNNGMRDQRLVFRWIKDNIAVFGGDPRRITVYGCSAAGTLTSMHPMVYSGRYDVPFQQAWMVSVLPDTALNISSDAATIHTTAVVERSGCGGFDDAETIECLRDLPMEDLLETALVYAKANHHPHGLFTFIPSVDGNFLPDRQSKLVETGKFAKGRFKQSKQCSYSLIDLLGITMVIGWTQDDGSANVPPPSMVQTEDDIIPTLKMYAYALAPEQLSMLFLLYPAEGYEARKAPGGPTVSVHWFRIARIARDLLFTCSSIDMCYQMIKQTRESGDKAFDGVRFYQFIQTLSTPLWIGAGMPWVGVNHGADAPYIFNGHYTKGEVALSDQNLAERISRGLITFAYTGNPVSSTTSK
jgi:carboxylesterase type B